MMDDSKSTNDERGTALVVSGQRIREDSDGHICLDDIFKIAGQPKDQHPVQWRRLSSTRRLILALIRWMERSRPDLKLTAETVAGFRRGSQPGTYAHAILAAVYAGYLSPDLEVEVRSVYLRHRAGDASLADEILQRASPEANQWAAARAEVRSGRNTYTDVLKAHDVVGPGYPRCTDAINREVLGGTAREVRQRRGLPKKANLRDHVDIRELRFLAAAEALATERIEEIDARGNQECEIASGRSARFIREAIESDRRDRQKSIAP